MHRSLFCLPLLLIITGCDRPAPSLGVGVDLPNPDGRLRTEMYVVAAISLTQPKVLTLPASVVAGEGKDAYVVQVVDGKTVHVPVRIGAVADGLIEVLNVTEKDIFIAENAAALAEGATVVIEGK